MSERTLDRYISDGRLPATKLTARTIRIRRVDVDALAAGATDSTSTPDVDAAASNPSDAAAPLTSGGAA